MGVLSDSEVCPTSHCSGVPATATDTSNSKLATGGDDSTVKIWNPSTGDHLYTLTGHATGVTSLAWLDSEARVASGGSDGSINLWNPTSNAAAVETIATAHSNEVSALL